MKIINTDIPGVVVIEPKIFTDQRGYFFESFSQRQFAEKVCDTVFVQDNESRSSYGVVRGHSHHLRAVDIRRGSPTFGNYVAVELTEENHRQLFVPRGFAHGFSVLSDVAVFQYKCDNYYAPEAEGAIAWDDPALGIDWRIPAGKIVLSAKDSSHPRLADSDELFDYYENLY